MRLLLMRHGIAAPLDDRIHNDAARPLTAEGEDKTRQAAAGLLACEAQIDLIASSPLLRAHQTAEIVIEACAAAKMKPAPRQETWPQLEYSNYSDLRARFVDLEQRKTVLIVGHEPGFSRLVAHLLTGSPTGLAVDFKKAAVCALEIMGFPEGDTIPQATLLWFATPRQLRLMGKNTE